MQAPSAHDNALIARADLKEYLGIKSSLTTEDGRLDEIIEGVSARISSHCGRKFEQATHTEYLSGDGTAEIRLPHWPVTSPLSDVSGGIWVDSTREFATATQLTEDEIASSTTGDYVVHPNEDGIGRVTRLGSVWPGGTLNIKAMWQGGYATIPGAIQAAAFRWAGHVYEVTRRRLHAASSVDDDPEGGRIAAVLHKMPDDVREMLHGWRTPRW